MVRWGLWEHFLSLEKSPPAEPGPCAARGGVWVTAPCPHPKAAFLRSEPSGSYAWAVHRPCGY